MKPAPLDPLARHVLRALYELAELDIAAHAGVLGRAVGQAAAEVERALRVLDARGLASAERARLTLLGLAQAARVPAIGLEREPWIISLAHRQPRPRAATLRSRAEQPCASTALHARAEQRRASTARSDGLCALPALRRCAGAGRPELKGARRTS
jgi:hypothetical protein